MRACSGSRSVHSCVRHTAALLSLVGAAAALGIEIESAGEHCSGTKLHVVPAGNEAQWDQRDRGCNGDPTEPFTSAEQALGAVRRLRARGLVLGGETVCIVLHGTPRQLEGSSAEPICQPSHWAAALGARPGAGSEQLDVRVSARTGAPADELVCSFQLEVEPVQAGAL